MRSLQRLARTAAVALVAIVLQPVILDAILVAPHAVFITHDEGVGEVYLVNQGDVPEEVTVELRFGFPTTDSLGNVGIRFVDDPGEEFPSAAAWLRAFPRRARVEPQQRQRVRIQATPPADLPDGEYWSRLVVTSQPVRERPGEAVDTVVRAGVTLQLRTITAVSYRKGDVSTGVRIDDFRATEVGDSLEVWVDLAREGNAAYLGTIEFTLLTPAGDVALSWQNPIAVYVDQHRRFMLPVGELPSGPYRLRMLVSTAREDIAEEYVLPADPVERTLGVTLEQ